MPNRFTTVDLPLSALFSRLVGHLMIVVVFVTTAIGLTSLNAMVPQPGAASEFSDPPGSGVIVHYEVIHLWLPETLGGPALHEFSALVSRTHQELKKALERRGQENLWYAITIRGHQVNNRATDISFIRYPYREPENIGELTDVVAIIAGSTPRHLSADYSTTVIHILPAGMSRREWLESMQATSLLRRAVPDELEPSQ